LSGVTPLLRVARPEDAAAIAALTREAYAKWVDVIGREPLPMQVDYTQALQRHRFDLLFVDDALAGLIETVADDEFLLIENLAVGPAWQKRGYGGDLLRSAESIANKAGLRGLRLYTNQRFTENIRFYQRFGFVTEREALHGGGVIVYMRKMLMQASPYDTTQVSRQVNLAEKLASFSELWSPRAVAKFNGCDVMVVKVQDEFVWHKHDDTDDFFLVLKGRLEIDLRDRTITLGPGELFIVPKGVEHRPRAAEETHLLLIEPAGTPNTGDVATAAPHIEI
jgi:mannose-6-phosphate isomerase-like protein (cupin superfamily)/ribosomal protein S18 acetylase RimI-like enzyme